MHLPAISPTEVPSYRTQVVWVSTTCLFFMSDPNRRLDEIGYQGMNLRHEWSHNRICTTAEAPGQYEEYKP